MTDSPQPPAAAPRPASDPQAKPVGALAQQAEAMQKHAGGLQIDISGEEQVDERLAAIEMVGEEVAAGFHAAPHQPLAPEVRFLHASRTIHELVTDRNRSVGIFLFVASVLIGATSALLNAHPLVDPIVPMREIQYWCLPVTFGTLAVIALFVSLLLIRTRIGLIYEVAKMNALLGLPSERVTRVSPLSVFYLMHLLVVVLGGASAGFTAMLLAYHLIPGATKSFSAPFALGLATSGAYVLILMTTYYLTILHTTSDLKLKKAAP
jgi:hypothetical protein